MVRKGTFGTKILQSHHLQTLHFGETLSSDISYLHPTSWLSVDSIDIDPKNVFVYSFYLFGLIQYLVGEFCRLEHQIQFGEVFIFLTFVSFWFLYLFHSCWCYPTLVGEILQTGASISIWGSWSPDGKFYWLNQKQIKFAQGKWSKFLSHFSSSVFLDRDHNFLWTANFHVLAARMKYFHIQLLFCVDIYEHRTIWRRLRCSSCCRLLCIISPSYLPRFIP